MADAYFFLFALLVLALTAAVVRGAVRLLRQRPGNAPQRDRFLRDLAWVLVIVVILLVTECLLMLLCDCSFRNFDSELRWYPSLLWEGAIVQRLVLAGGAALGAFAMWSPRTRALCLRPFTALATAYARRAPAQPRGVWVVTIAIALVALVLFLTSLQALPWFFSAWQWENFRSRRGIDSADLTQIGQVVLTLPIAWALAMLACHLCGRRRGAWRITLALALVSFGAFAAAASYYTHQALTVQRSSISMGIPELAAAMCALPAAFSLWAIVYLISQRAHFAAGRGSPG